MPILETLGLVKAAPATFAGIKVTTLAVAAKIGIVGAGTVVTYKVAKKIIKTRRYNALTSENRKPVDKLMESLRLVEDKIKTLDKASLEADSALRKQAKKLAKDVDMVLTAQVKRQKRLEADDAYDRAVQLITEQDADAAEAVTA